MTDVTNFPPENLSLTFYLQGNPADQVKFTHLQILQFILVFCKCEIICHDNINNQTRLFQNISEYHFNTISFNPLRHDFRGNNVNFKPGDMGSLEKNVFNTFDSQYVTKMYLHHQNIKKLNPGAFLFLDCLKELDLHTNKIESLPEELFLNLNHLEELDLSENLLQEVPPCTFNNISALKSLNLSANKIKKMSKYSFFQLKNLEKLDLSYNNLSTINDATFDYLISLKVLLLNGNKLTIIGPEKWSSLFHLRVLDLSQNLLQNFDTGYRFSFSLTLRYLNLSDNQLTQLNVFGLGRNIPNVSVLGIERNMWLCFDLELMVNILRGSNVIYKGTINNGTQIDGISCYNGKEEYPKTSSVNNETISEPKGNLDIQQSSFNQAQFMMSFTICLLIIVVVILFFEVLLRCNVREFLGRRSNNLVLDNSSNVEHIALITR